MPISPSIWLSTAIQTVVFAADSQASRWDCSRVASIPMFPSTVGRQFGLSDQIRLPEPPSQLQLQNCGHLAGEIEPFVIGHTGPLLPLADVLMWAYAIA